VVIYGAAAPPPLGEAERIHAFRKRIGLPNGARYLFSLGRLHPKKGLDCLIPAFAETTRRRSHIRLVIAGPDPDGMTPALIDLARTHGIADRVQFTGPLSGDLKWGALEGADALALITHQENFGLVLAEALACATPVITTPRTNIWRELDRSGAAVLCDDTPAGATEGLGRFLALDPEMRAQMRRKARDAYIDRFTVEAATQSLMGVLSRAAQGLQ
jgi:glycosyltransferase involved in cell wall biosynthesis